MKVRTDISELFRENSLLKICAPMVRYSKLQFRTLVRSHNVDLCFTPMILADSFCCSNKARNNEFTTDLGDGPLIVQFAARTVHDFVGAAEMIYPYADGVDLNCGCPQRWAINDGYGCGLLTQPQQIKELVTAVRGRLPNPFSVSVKIRLLPTVLETVELCRQLEHCGVTFLTVHGRTPIQKSEPVNTESLSEIKKSIQIPLVANGDIKHLEDAYYIQKQTNCDGVMAARGILANPAMYDGTICTPMKVIQEWADIVSQAGPQITFQCFHHHLVFMLEKIIPKQYRVIFNNFTKKDQVFNFLEQHYNIIPQKGPQSHEQIDCIYEENSYKQLKLQNVGFIDNPCKKCKLQKSTCICEHNIYYNGNENKGKFFEDNYLKQKEICDLDYMDSSLFDTI